MPYVLVLLCLSTVQADDRKAPEFSLQTLEGDTFSLADAAGEVVYLDFWASWCGPCKLSFPDMQTLQTEFGENISVVAISVDEQADAARKFLKRYPSTFTVLTDPTGSVAADYDIPAMPTTFLLDGNRNVRHVHAGYRPGDLSVLRSEIRKILDEGD